jgi:fermentation-respiration switch protein FrsA (DUF1100 family)
MAARHLVRAAIILAVVVVLGLAAVWWGQRRLIYFPDTAAPAPDPRAEEVAVQTADGLRLTATLVRPTGPDRAVAVLVTHGNAGHRGHRMPLAAALAGAGFTVLVAGYRGYGGNPGSPSEDGLIEDARAALARLATAGFTPGRIIYFGESLGAAVAARLAVEQAPAALVLRSPFTELADVAAHHYPWLPVRALLRDRYPATRHLAGLTVPVTVIYGGADTIVPPELSSAVSERARFVRLPHADHNDAALTHGPEVVAAVAGAAPLSPS